MSQPIRSLGGHFVFPFGPKNTNLVEDVEILLPVKFCLIPFSGFRGEVENVSANQRQGSHFLFSNRPDKHKLGTGHWDLASYQVSFNSVQRFQRRSRKMSQPIRGQGGHLVFLIGPKNTNLVEDVEILLPVKFRWIPFSGFRGEVENVSANQRPWQPSCSSDQPEIHKLGRGHWDLPSYQVSLNSVQQPGRPSCFSDRPKKHKLGRGRWDLASSQVSLNSVQRFQRRSRKCQNESEAVSEKKSKMLKVNHDGRRTTQ